MQCEGGLIACGFYVLLMLLLLRMWLLHAVGDREGGQATFLTGCDEEAHSQ